MFGSLLNILKQLCSYFLVFKQGVPLNGGNSNTGLYHQQIFLNHYWNEGCDWNETSLMFLQIENDTDPIENWSWRLKTEYKIVPNKVGWPHYNWMPDGHFSTLKVDRECI